MRFTYSLELVRRGAWAWKANDMQRIPRIDDIVNTDTAWLDDLLTYIEMIRYYEDIHKQNN